jgi:hypothetical protein
MRYTSAEAGPVANAVKATPVPSVRGHRVATEIVERIPAYTGPAKHFRRNNTRGHS